MEKIKNKLLLHSAFIDIYNLVLHISVSMQKPANIILFQRT